MKHKTIAHGINFGAYLAVSILCVWIFQMNPTRSIVFFLSAFFNRQISFDIPLNLRRKLDWHYVSRDNPPKALMDKIEVRIFGYNGRASVLIYSIAWIVLTTIYFFV